MPRHLRAGWRLLRLLVHALWGLWLVAWRFPRLSSHQQQARVQLVAGPADLRRHHAAAARPAAARGAGAAGGQPPFVAGHSRTTCGALLPLHLQVRPEGLAPIVGTLATAAGTLYIRRESRRDALRMVTSMRDALLAGEVLAVFPEGQTGDGRALLPFHANLLQLALGERLGAPVQPVGLRFLDGIGGATSDAPELCRPARAFGLRSGAP